MRYLLSCLLLAGLLVAAPPKTEAATTVSVDVFYNALEPQGEWLEVGDYGYCWRPNDVAEDWRPYADGHWVYTDLGWTWVSDEPWGWATYHYGRWAEVDDVGWVWVPGTEWAPAWVSWRHSNRYVGWAPLPPEARFEARIGIKAWADGYYDIGPANYSFVEVRHFGAPSLRVVLVEPRQNITIINETTNITNITYNNNVVVNNGPQYEVVSRASEQPIQRLKIERRTDMAVDAQSLRTQKFTTQVSGDKLQIMAPPVSATAVTTVQPKVTRKIEATKIQRGWDKAGDAAAVQQARAKVKSEAKVPAELPPQPKFEKVSATGTATAAAGASPSAAETSAAAGASATASPASATAAPAATATPAVAREMASPAASPAMRPKGAKGRKAAAGMSPAPAAGVSPAMSPAGKKARKGQMPAAAPSAESSPGVSATPAMAPAPRVKRKMQPAMATPVPAPATGTESTATESTPPTAKRKAKNAESMATPPAARMRPTPANPESTPPPHPREEGAAAGADRPAKPHAQPPGQAQGQPGKPKKKPAPEASPSPAQP